MDARFLAALAAIRQGDPRRLNELVEADPELATARSSCSHPTLMQALALDAVEQAADIQLEMARSLRERGSPLDEPLIAAASVGNVVVGGFLLDHGAAIDGREDLLEGWTPLEESLYWGNPAMTQLLIDRGASVHSLRAAAGLGRLDALDAFFDAKGQLRASGGTLNCPFGSVVPDDPDQLPQSLLDNALSYAAMGGHTLAAERLLDRGARINEQPLGFHFRGTALHWAAIRNHREMCDVLLGRGADPTIEDLQVHSTPAGWARHDGHEILADYLDAKAQPPG